MASTEFKAHHEAPSGFHFTLRPPSLVPERLRRPVVAKMMDVARSVLTPDGREPSEEEAAALAMSMTAEDLARADDLNDLLALALLTSWSVEAAISLDALLDLPMGDYDAVRAAVAPQVTAMMPDFSVTPEPDTPTSP
jgi:hypothetical protein